MITNDDRIELAEAYEAVAAIHQRLLGSTLGKGLTVSGLPWDAPVYPPEDDHRERIAEAIRWAQRHRFAAGEEV